jgi:hypothetical protein
MSKEMGLCRVGRERERGGREDTAFRLRRRRAKDKDANFVEREGECDDESSNNHNIIINSSLLSAKQKSKHPNN